MVAGCRRPRGVSPTPWPPLSACPTAPAPVAILSIAVGLLIFGFMGAYLGGASVFRGGMRVVIG